MAVVLDDSALYARVVDYIDRVYVWDGSTADRQNTSLLHLLIVVGNPDYPPSTSYLLGGPMIYHNDETVDRVDFTLALPQGSFEPTQHTGIVRNAIYLRISVSNIDRESTAPGGVLATP